MPAYKYSLGSSYTIIHPGGYCTVRLVVWPQCHPNLSVRLLATQESNTLTVPAFFETSQAVIADKVPEGKEELCMVQASPSLTGANYG